MSKKTAQDEIRDELTQAIEKSGKTFDEINNAVNEGVKTRDSVITDRVLTTFDSLMSRGDPTPNNALANSMELAMLETTACGLSYAEYLGAKKTIEVLGESSGATT